MVIKKEEEIKVKENRTTQAKSNSSFTILYVLKYF